ncbi:dipeptidase [Microbacter margulisiae]|uniref:Dipeptidase n=1 Tax=Microbacter margulisiae TaxID=1350067 RepID=A0A7W5DQE1_9PORP|nr:C69 family dipeptidase [Microbacter margulisiae]MBB3187117.1 dipeptidase [Microbacter margulisiae]
MKKFFFLILLLTVIVSRPYACTNFLVGKDASATGAAYITYNADSYFLFGALYYRPAANYPKGAMMDIYDWDTGNYRGQIKQAEHTYSVVGNMNQYQVTIAETTFGGRPELVDTTAVLDYGSLMYIALQRSRTAREAIKVMASLVNEYGYGSEGESFSIGDPEEVWILEMIGKGPKNKGAVWVAERIPDDCVSAHANQARITTFPLDDPKNCLYAPDVISFARSKGYYNGTNKDFSFSDTYAPLDYVALRACEARVWSFFRKMDTTMNKYITYVKGETKERMPLWIKPSHKVTLHELMLDMRDRFEGTEFDITKGVGAGPFGSPLRCSPLVWTYNGKEYLHERPTATYQTGFTFVAEMRRWLPDPVGGILWFGVDDAACSEYVPMYCGINKVPECFSPTNGSLLKFSWTSAFWIFNWVSNMAYSKYCYMIQDINKEQSKWENKFTILTPAVDKAAAYLMETDTTAACDFLTEFSDDQAEAVTHAWKKLGEYLMVKYMDGNIKVEKDGKFVQNAAGIPPTIDRPGYPDDFKRQIIQANPDEFRVKTQAELDNRKQ